MASPHSPGSSFDDSEFESPSSGTPNRFFDGLQSSVTEDEFSDLLNSLRLSSSVVLRLLGEADRPSHPVADEVAFNVRSFEFRVTLPLPRFIRRLLGKINIAPIQAHPHFYKFVMACYNIWKSQKGCGDPSFNDLGGLVSSRLNSNGVFLIRSRDPTVNPVRFDQFSDRKWASKWVFASGDWGAVTGVGDNFRFVRTHINHDGIHSYSLFPSLYIFIRVITFCFACQAFDSGEVARGP